MELWLNCKFEYTHFGDRQIGRAFVPHNHSAYELVYYVKGSGYITIDQNRYEFSPGMYSLTEPGHTHEEYYNEKGHVIYVLFSSTEKLPELTDSVFADSDGYPIRHIMEEIKKAFFSDSDYKSIKLDLQLKLLLVELASLNNNLVPLSDLGGCIQYMHEYCTEKIDFKKLAGNAGYSYSHFRKLVKEQTGRSPINYVIECRLERAKYLLKYTTLPISYISQECGFSTESQFCSIFRRILRITPNTYRKQIIEDSQQPGRDHPTL